MPAPPQFDHEAMRTNITAWSDETVVLGDRGAEAPRWFDAELSHPEWSSPATLRVVVDEETGPVLAGVRADRTDPPPASYRAMVDELNRTMPINDLLRLVTALAVATATAIRYGEQSGLTRGLAGLSDAAIAARIANLQSFQDTIAESAWDATQPRRKRFVTRELLQEVASVYRQAHAEGAPPTVAVAEHFHVSHRTATRWVGQARDKGELGPAQGTRPGEVSPST